MDKKKKMSNKLSTLEKTLKHYFTTYLTLFYLGTQYS